MSINVNEKRSVIKNLYKVCLFCILIDGVNSSPLDIEGNFNLITHSFSINNFSKLAITNLVIDKKILLEPMTISIAPLSKQGCVEVYQLNKYPYIQYHAKFPIIPVSQNFGIKLQLSCQFNKNLINSIINLNYTYCWNKLCVSLGGLGQISNSNDPIHIIDLLKEHHNIFQEELRHNLQQQITSSISPACTNISIIRMLRVWLNSYAEYILDTQHVKLELQSLPQPQLYEACFKQIAYACFWSHMPITWPLICQEIQRQQVIDVKLENLIESIQKSHLFREALQPLSPSQYNIFYNYKLKEYQNLTALQQNKDSSYQYIDNLSKWLIDHYMLLIYDTLNCTLLDNIDIKQQNIIQNANFTQDPKFFSYIDLLKLLENNLYLQDIDYLQEDIVGYQIALPETTQGILQLLIQFYNEIKSIPYIPNHTNFLTVDRSLVDKIKADVFILSMIENLIQSYIIYNKKENLQNLEKYKIPVSENLTYTNFSIFFYIGYRIN